jgi:excisionase family DNA binding protein
MQQAEQNILLNRRDSARLLGISLRLLDTLISTKELAVRRIRRRVLIHRYELERFARKRA